MKKAFGSATFKTLLTAAVLLAGSTVAAVAAPAPAVTLIETGSSLLYPLFNAWLPAYQKVAPQVSLVTASTGSGTGIAQSIAGLVQIGASDAYLPEFLASRHPTMLNIALAIAGQDVVYNVPGLNKDHLKLSGKILAEIYQGEITEWDNKAIEAANPGIKLPDQKIIPVHRADGSGDTFIFSQYLSAASAVWNNNVGYGTTLSWPVVPDSIGANGNPGMLSALKTTPYSIGYVGMTFTREIHKYNLGIAALQNKEGHYILPSEATLQAASATMVDKTPADQRVSLIYADGQDSYPIVTYEYAVVNSVQPSAVTAAAMRHFLNWAVDPEKGSSEKFLTPLYLVPLPARVLEQSRAQIAKIGS